MEKSLLRLFNCVLVGNQTSSERPYFVDERTIRNGYVLDGRVEPTDEVLSTIEENIGLSAEKANAAFHKSWTVIENSSTQELVAQQVLHYFSTYGLEELGLYKKNTVYIPQETLQTPGVSEDLPLVFVQAATKNEVLTKVIELGKSGVALSKETLQDIMSLVEQLDFSTEFVPLIKNQELKSLLIDHYGLVSSDPVEFLRYLVSKLTDEALLIKNKSLIEKLENANGKFLDTLLKDAPEDLASIFLRYKPLFLAMKKISKNKTFFNRLRKQANKLHKPLPVDYLNSVTSQLKNGNLDLDELKQKLENTTIFRKIRLANALSFRLNQNGSVVYRIRNGSGWATDFEWCSSKNELVQQALKIVKESIASTLRLNVEGKSFYVPSYAHYTMPATEKQYTGNLPTGSYITVPEDLIVGIHWFNTERRIDLDLSAIGQSGKIGWDGSYRAANKGVLFSGDMTDAPRPDGVTELLYLKNCEDEPRILNVNYFNFQSDDPVECKLIAAHEKPDKEFQNYMVDTNKIVAQANIEISNKQTVLGLFAKVDGENRVYFSKTSIGNSITSREGAVSSNARNYLVAYASSMLDLKELLQMAGATVTDENVDEQAIDLSPSALSKSTIIELISAGS